MPKIQPKAIKPGDIIGYKTRQSTSVVHNISGFGQRSMGYVAEIITDERTSEILGVLICEIVRPDASADVKRKLQTLQSDELRFLIRDGSKLGVRGDGSRTIIPITRFIPINDILISSKTEAWLHGRVEDERTAQAIESAMQAADRLSTDQDNRHALAYRGTNPKIWDAGSHSIHTRKRVAEREWDNVPTDISRAMQAKQERYTYGGEPKESKRKLWFGKIGAASAGAMPDLPLIFAEKAGMPKYLVQAFTAPARGSNLKPLVTLRQASALSEKKLSAYLQNAKTGLPEDLTVKEAFKESENPMAQLIAEWIQDEGVGSESSNSFIEIREAKEHGTLTKFIGHTFYTGQAEDIIKEILPKLKKRYSEITPDIKGAQTAIQETWDKLMQATIQESNMPEFTNDGPAQQIILVKDRRVKVPEVEREIEIERGASTIIKISAAIENYLTRDLN